MSFEQQFYLKKNRDIVKDDSYYGDMLFWLCGQRDFAQLLMARSTKIDEYTFSFDREQANQLVKELFNEATSFVTILSATVEEYGSLRENEDRMERLAIDSYAILSNIEKRSKRLDNSLFYSLSGEEPIELLVFITSHLLTIILEMDIDDELIMELNY